MLRVHENGAVMMLGSVATRQMDFRLITATDKEWQREIENGNLRRALHYRLNGIPTQVPPLRERKEIFNRWSKISWRRFAACRAFRKKLV